jgi:hypothetical protein
MSLQAASLKKKERNDRTTRDAIPAKEPCAEYTTDTDTEAGVPLFMQPFASSFTVPPRIQRQVGPPEEEEAIQAKIAVGEPNDEYEQEADRVADHAVQNFESGGQPKPT